MSRTGWKIGRNRLSLATLGLVGMLVLGACGGSASQTTGWRRQRTSAPGEPTPTTGHRMARPTEGPGASIDAGNGSEAFSAATTALDALDSYAFSVEIDLDLDHATERPRPATAAIRASP